MKRSVLLLSIMGVLVMTLFAAAAVGQEDCPVPSGSKVVLTGSNWTFDPATGLLKGSATVMNVTDSVVVAPGVIISLYNMGGEQFDNVMIRGRQPRVSPGEKTEVPFEIQLRQIPLSLLIGPFEGMAFT